MPNLSVLAPITTTATALSNLILATPQSVRGYQPQSKNGNTNNQVNLQQVPAILFHYEGEQTVAIESDITDHFVENNTAIQDQIALKPVTITTHGFVGELNDIVPRLLAPLQFLANKLTIINAYTPVLSSAALIAYNEAFQAYQVAENAKNAAVAAWGTIVGDNVLGSQTVIGNAPFINTAQSLATQNKQQQVFQQFFGYWSDRILFTVQTPWAIFQNMAIKSLRAIQDAETNVISDFEVQFKMIRFASTTTITDNSKKSKQARRFQQSQQVVNLGTSTPASSLPLNTALGQ
jgi:hypothetical protein